MPRSWIHRIVPLLALLILVPALASAWGEHRKRGPLQRLRQLEHRVSALEASSPTRLVVVDANGVEVGDAVDLGRVNVVLQREGFPLIALEATRSQLAPNVTERPWYETDDCTGQAWFEIEGSPFLAPPLFTHIPSLVPLLVGDDSQAPTDIVAGSRRSALGCEPESTPRPVTGVVPALNTGIFLNLEFTPPFRLIVAE